MLSEEFFILASFFLSLMSRKLVLQELRAKRFAVIDEEIC